MGKDKIFPPPSAGVYSLAHKSHIDSLRAKSPALQALHLQEQNTEKATKEMSKEEVATILDTTIKHDKVSKTVIFYGTVLNYTKEDQQNFSSNGPSAVGKSWIVEQVLSYFPPEDLLSKGYTSPTAFWHLNSELCKADGEPLDNRDRYVDDLLKQWEEENLLPPKGEGRENWKEARKTERRRLKNEWDDIDKFYVVNLESKILHFRDQPHDKLLQNLRPVLSHDSKIIEINITDKTKEGGNRTKKVLIIGYPTVHFNSVRFSLDEQERTRLWLTSPEITQDKFRDTLKQQSVSLANRAAFKDELKKNESRQFLKMRIRLIKDSPVREVIIKPEYMKKIYEKFLKDHPRLTPRHQRDFPRLIAMIKAHALFNQWTRDHTDAGDEIYANDIDVKEGPLLCKTLIESNELGLPPHVFRFYEEKLRPELEAAIYGLHHTDLSRLYYEFYYTRIGKKPLKNMIDLLLETGLMIEETDPDDKRRKKLYTPTLGVEKKGTTEKDSQEAAKDELLKDIADFFTSIGGDQADQNKLYAYIKEKHQLEKEELISILKDWPELFELDGWTIRVKLYGESEPEQGTETPQQTKPRSLQNQLQKVLQVISDLERISGSAKESDLYETLLTDFGINRSEGARLISMLMKDGTIYMPRPGYYRRTS